MYLKKQCNFERDYNGIKSLQHTKTKCYLIKKKKTSISDIYYFSTKAKTF